PALRRLHSFPTRRSSDLRYEGRTAGIVPVAFETVEFQFHDDDAERSIRAVNATRNVEARAIAGIAQREILGVPVFQCVVKIGARSEEHTSELQSRENLVC